MGEKRKSFLQGCKILFPNPSIKYYSLESIRLASHFLLITKSLFILIHKFSNDTNFQFKSHAVFLCGLLSHLPIEEADCGSVLSISFQSLTAPLTLLQILGFKDHILDAKSFKSIPSFGMQAIHTKLHQI